MVKILFFDTNALLKIFINEPGSDTVNWLISANVRLVNSLHCVVNEQACDEFNNKIANFAKNGKISVLKANNIIDKFNQHYKNNIFSVIGYNIISNTKEETSLITILQRLSLVQGKNDWDGKIYQSIVNALACYGGGSHPILITSDFKFGKKVAANGFRVIDPSKQSREEILALLVRFV